MKRIARALLRLNKKYDKVPHESPSPSSTRRSNATAADTRALDNVSPSSKVDEDIILGNPEHTRETKDCCNTLNKDRSYSHSSSSLVLGSEEHDEVHSLAKELGDTLDLRDSTDADQVTTHAPAVFHESVHPHVHEIQQERIYREIHNHEVYHRVQPVYDVEVLPARHFVPGPDGSLVEIPEDEIPDFTPAPTVNKWNPRENTSFVNSQYPAVAQKLARAAPVDEKNYVTPEGIPRTETTIVHPATLEKISHSGSPVLPVHFDEHDQGQDMLINERVEHMNHLQTHPQNASERNELGQTTK